MPNFSYDGHEVETSELEPRLGSQFGRVMIRDIVRDTCLQGRILQTQGVSWNSLPESTEVEEKEMPIQDIARASLGFERNRAKVMRQLRAIVRGIIREYKLPTTNGIDIGSGATGAMIGDLMPTTTNWKQVEINPAAVKENKRRHPDKDIVTGSYFKLSDIVAPESLDIVTGLSSLDATSFLSTALESIWSVLKPGGVLLHVQDVRPGNGATARWVKRRGYTGAQDMDMTADGSVYGIHDPKETYISATELLRRELGDVIINRKDAALILNAWTTAKTRTTGTESGAIYYQNVALTGSPQTRLPEMLATAVVTIAKKV